MYAVLAEETLSQQWMPKTLPTNYISNSAILNSSCFIAK